MANKKDDTKGLANIGKGILSSLEDIKGIKENSNGVKEETNKPVNNEVSKTIKEETSKQIKDETLNTVKEEKKKKEKKNFMLTETAVNQLFELKFKYRKKDYSQIVEEAIAEYYEKHI